MEFENEINVNDHHIVGGPCLAILLTITFHVPALFSFLSYFLLSECEAKPVTIDQDERLLQEIYNYIVEFREQVTSINDQLVRVCGTANPNFLVDVASSLLGYTCVAVGIIWRLKEAFQCSTWMPLYYNTAYNAMCYNGTGGVWAIAASQFLTSFMTCIILTCRCVFFDLEIEGEEDEDQEEENEEEEDQDDKQDEELESDDKKESCIAEPEKAMESAQEDKDEDDSVLVDIILDGDDKATK